LENLTEKQLIGHKGQDQLLDFYLIEELIAGSLKGYPGRVAKKLLEHNVVYKKNVIYSRAKTILAGKTVLIPSADVDGRPSARDGKDKMYAGLWTMVDLALPFPECRNYIGLTANQLDNVRSHLSSSFMVVCERNKEKSEKLKQLAAFIEKAKQGPQIIIENEDIFEVLKEKKNSFNIFDLDLMSILPRPAVLDKWAQIFRSSAKEGKVVANITTTIGRSLTEEEHLSRVGYLRQSLESVGFRELGYSPFGYRDRYTPMRSMRLILKTINP
jgi:hypothetical protein